MTGLAAPLAHERSLQPVQSRGEDPGEESAFKMQPSRPSKRSELRTLTKEKEWRTRAGGKQGRLRKGEREAGRARGRGGRGRGHGGSGSACPAGRRRGTASPGRQARPGSAA